MALSLNDILRAAIEGDKSVENVDPTLTQEAAETQKTAEEVRAGLKDEDVEGLAALAERMGSFGVEKILQKTATIDVRQTAENKDRHPALASNQSAMDATKKVKAEITQQNLKKEWKATPFADPGSKQAWRHGHESDKNINSGHQKKAHDPEAVKAEIQRRLLMREASND